jgi:hypothetical protein
MTDESNQNEFYLAIGRFVAEFSRLEALLKWMIEDGIKLDDKYSGVVVTHDFAMLCTIAENVLSRDMDEAKTAQFVAVIRKCRELNDHRVRVVHGLWTIGRRKGSLVHRSRQKLESRSYWQNAGELAAQADATAKLWFDLADFWNPPKSK